MAALELINHQELSGTATTITYTSIPSTYKHLYFVASTKTDNSSGNINMGVRFYTGSSSEVSSGYSGRFFKIGGYLGSSTPIGAAQTSQAQWSLIYKMGDNLSQPTFTSTEFLIANYPIPFYLGGTSILIVVVVAIDTVTQIQTRLMSSQYEQLIKKTKFGR